MCYLNYMLCQISKDLLIQQNDCYTNYHVVTLTIPKRGMCWFNTSYKVLINKPFVGLTNPFLQCTDCLSVNHIKEFVPYFNQYTMMKSTSSSYVQIMIDNMVWTSYWIRRTLSQAKVDMSQAFKLCHATS